MQDGKGVLFDSPAGLTEAIFRNQPGQSVTLWRVRPGTDPSWVSVPLERAIAERKPLLSLFFTPDAADQPPRWLAWTPSGSYDLSDQALEDFLGWHFNTGQADAPTRFAVAAMYRRFRRSGLLRESILGPEPPVPLPPPRADLLLDPEDRGDGMPRKRPQGVNFVLLDRLFPLEAIESVRLSLDSGDPEPLRRTSARAWAAEFTGRRIDPRRWHMAMAVIRTNEATPQEFTYKLRFRFVPGPPTIVVDQPASSRVLDQERFVVSARIEAPLEGESVRVRLRHGANAVLGPEQIGVSPFLFRQEVVPKARHQRDRDRSPPGRSPGAGDRAGNRTQGDPGHVHEKATRRPPSPSSPWCR